MICALAFLLAVSGCETQPSTPASASDESPDKTAPHDARPLGKKKKKNAPAPTPGAALTPLEIEKFICKGHTHCRSKQTWDAGLDAHQQPMQVVEITTDSKLTDKLKKDVSYFHKNRDITPCEPLEYWFVRPTLIHNDTPETQPALLSRACGGSDPNSVTDGDKVTIEPGRFTSSVGSSSGVIYSTERTVELPSLQIIESTDGFWARNRNDFYSNTWNWQKMAGQNSGFDPHCENETGDYGSSEHGVPNFNYQPIIMAKLPAAFRKDHWKSTSLASCSTTVTSLGNKARTLDTGYLDTGYVTYGKTGNAKDASFKVVMASPTELYVEVTDPTLVHDAKNILHTDHLEIWMRKAIVCPKPKKTSLFQWGITLDGKVHNFYGKHPQSPTAKTSIRKNKAGPHTIRFKITIPDDYEGLTIVYSDSDDGKSQKRLIATSDVKYRDQFSVGAVKNIAPERGTCSIKKNKLQFTPKPQKPRSPVTSDSDESDESTTQTEPAKAQPNSLPPIVLDEHGEYPWYNEKIGALETGQSTQEVEKLLGPPSQKGDDDFMPATGAYYVFWSYKKEGIGLMFSASEKKSPRTLGQISIYPPSKLKTQRGIGIGSTRAEAEVAYEKPAYPREKVDSDESDDGRVIVGSIYGGLVFYIEDGLVSGIFLGASAE